MLTYKTNSNNGPNFGGWSYTHPNMELAREYINKLPTYSSGKIRDQGVTKLVIFDYI